MPAIPAVATESTEASPRRRVLAMHLERARTFCDMYAGQGDEDVRLDMGQQSLTLEPWVRESILSSAVDEGVGDVLAQCVAVLMKISSDFESYETMARAEGEQRYALQAELMLDTAIGAALLRELQHAVNEAVGSGDMGKAKSLSRFQHEMRRGLASTKKGIAQTEEASVERLTDSLTDRPRDEAPAEDTAPRLTGRISSAQEARALSRQVRRRVVRVAARLPARTDILIGVLALVFVLWIGTVMLPRVLSDDGPRPLTLEELQSDTIHSVEARPPSLYVHLDEGEWLRLTDDERGELLERVSVILLTNGYTGALFDTTGGRPVARWLVAHGSEMILTEEEPLEPVSALPPATRFGARPIATQTAPDSAAVH
jgi:hypothetical protein